MQLSKFIKITGFLLSFVNSLSIYADKQIIRLWATKLKMAEQQATKLCERQESFLYYIQNVDTLVWFLENCSKFIDGDCKINEGCLLYLLNSKCNSEYRENIIKIELEAIKSEKIGAFFCALQKIVILKEWGQDYISTSDWGDISAHYDELYIMDDGEIISVTSEAEEEALKERMLSDLKFATEIRRFELGEYSYCKSGTSSPAPHVEHPQR